MSGMATYTDELPWHMYVWKEATHCLDRPVVQQGPWTQVYRETSRQSDQTSSWRYPKPVNPTLHPCGRFHPWTVLGIAPYRCTPTGHGICQQDSRHSIKNCRTALVNPSFAPCYCTYHVGIHVMDILRSIWYTKAFHEKFDLNKYRLASLKRKNK